MNNFNQTIKALRYLVSRSLSIFLDVCDYRTNLALTEFAKSNINNFKFTYKIIILAFS